MHDIKWRNMCRTLDYIQIVCSRKCCHKKCCHTMACCHFLVKKWKIENKLLNVVERPLDRLYVLRNVAIRNLVICYCKS